MQIGQDELLTECEVINQSSKRQLVIIQLNYLLIRTHIHIYTHTHMHTICVMYVFGTAAH